MERDQLDPVAAGPLADPDLEAEGVPPAVDRSPGNQAILGGLVDALGPGQPLDAQTRQRMESAFGASFGHVLVHTGAEAGAATRQHAAQAMTIGAHIAFAPGNYRPGTPVGDAMLAHELAHTIQQRRAGGDGVDGAPLPLAAAPATAAAPALETDAETAATGAMLRLWGATGRATTAGFRDTRPALASALRVQRCSCGGAPPHAAVSGPIPFESRNLLAAVGPGLHPAEENGHLRLRPSTYRAWGDVVALGGSDDEAPNWTAGYTQTGLDARRNRNYSDIATGTPTVREFVEVTQPSLDGGIDALPPWYGDTASFATARARVHVEMDDTPTERANWEDNGHQVQLVSTSGHDHYCSWLAVKHRSSAEPIYLNWDTWEVDWSTGVTRSGTSPPVVTGAAGAGAQVTDRGPGQGTRTPVLRQPFFNTRLNDPANRHTEPWDGTD